MRLRSLAAAITALSLCLGAACGGDAGRSRVIVLGLDGMDPEALDLLMSEGKLPNFARLRQQGAYGRLRSSRPLLSPIIWTTIATGKDPLEHGISHFAAVNEKTGERLPVTSRMRRVKALWNIVSEASRRVAVVGWWATWPAESVDGVIVSDHTCYHFLFGEGEGQGARDSVGLVHPPEAAARLARWVRRPGDVTPAEAARFVDVPPAEFERPFDFADDLSHFRWALASAESYRAIGLELWEEEQPDLLMVYVEGVDSTSHLFGHLFRQSDLSGELAAQRQRYGRAVEEMYRYADEIVGDYLAALDDDTTLVVLSDHGFQLGVLHDDPSKARDLRRVSERYHRDEGILYFYGDLVRAGRRLDEPTLLDVAPTLLALLGVSPARDMPGRVLDEALDLPAAFTTGPREIASYETGAREVAAALSAGDASADSQILEHLRALGYLESASPEGDRNRAALLFQAGRHAEAAALYAELVQREPDDGALRASFAGALGALGRLDESLAQLDRAVALQPDNPEAYHNRGVIHERRGDPESAAREYRLALRFQPDYGPARAALVRLQGPQALTEPQLGPSEKLASVLAGRAQQAALRGEYESAMALLDEAERIAPRLALVHHYRSNVAYLMDDRARAVTALRRAIELEPENPLFRANLERLDAQPPAQPDSRLGAPR